MQSRPSPRRSARQPRTPRTRTSTKAGKLRTKLALEESEAGLRSVFDHSRDVIYRLNLQTHRFEYVSPSAEAVTGYCVGEFMAMDDATAEAMIHPDDLAVVLTARGQLETAGVAEAEYRQRAKSGEYRWVSNRMALTRDFAGRPLYRDGNIRDVTERTRAEEQAARDLDAMTRLHKLSTLFVTDGDLRPILDEIVDAAIAIAGADFGNVQLLDPATGDLRIAAHRGFPQWWLDFWNNAGTGTGACGTALDRGERIIVENVEDSAIFAGKPVLDIQLRAGVRAVQSTPLISRAGRPVGMFSTYCTRPHRPDEPTLRLLDLLARQAADIIERARAEEALNESDRRNSEILDSIQDDFYVLDRDWRFVFASRSFTSRVGREPGDFTGKNIWEMFPEHLGTIYEENLRAAMDRRETREFELRGLYTDGWYRMRVYPSVEGITLLGVDISERRQVEEALRESERSLAEANRQRTDVLESISDCFYALDEDLRFTYVNKAAEEIWGLSRADLIGRKIEDVFGGLIDISLSKFRQVTAQHEPQHYEVYSNVVQRWGDMSVYPTQNGVSVYFHDITERKRADEALRDANVRLAEADRRKDEFLAMLAHELRNPLSVIGAASEILQRAGAVEPELQRARDAIDRQARHMTRLVDDLLDVSRVTQGKIGLKKERVPVPDILRHAVEATAPMVHALGHKLFVSLPSESLSIDGDGVRLTQVVANVLHNAAKYTPAGGEIYLSVERRDRQAEIRVRDNGQGINAALLPHVFDLFVQGDRSADRAQGGLGIGLTMARSLVAMHGGTIEAHSGGRDTGSEFVITLPLAQAAGEPCVTDRQGAGDSVSLRILVVDDNRDAAEMMRTLLEMDGHQAVAVCDGRAAIERAVAWRPDVGLIDLGMPGVDGFEVARRLRAERSLDRMVLVALTGYGQEEDVRRSREAGFDHHVTKSADLGPLRRVLGSMRSDPE